MRHFSQCFLTAGVLYEALFDPPPLYPRAVTTRNSSQFIIQTDNILPYILLNDDCTVAIT